MLLAQLDPATKGDGMRTLGRLGDILKAASRHFGYFRTTAWMLERARKMEEKAAKLTATGRLMREPGDPCWDVALARRASRLRAEAEELRRAAGEAQ